MVSRKTQGLERAFALYRAASGAMSLDTLNATLEGEGLVRVSSRMYVHLGRLLEDGVPSYVPANQHEQWRKARRHIGSEHGIAHDAQAALRDQNPWWRGAPAKPGPEFQRWLFARVRSALIDGLTPAVSLRGPRRIGKTVLVQQLIAELIGTGVKPTRILFVSFDEIASFKHLTDPILALARWYEEAIVGCTFNQAAIDGQPVYLFFDEVQNLDHWAPQLKSLVDHHAVRVLVTGSSSLRIAAGQDSLAGRITSIEMGPLLLREIASLRRNEPIAPYWANGGPAALVTPEFWLGLAQEGRRQAALRDDAFRHYSERGAYPIAHLKANVPWEELADYLRQSVVERAIKHDLAIGPHGPERNADLLYELLKACCRYAGQAVSPRRLVRHLKDLMAFETTERRVREDLEFLDQTLLLRLIDSMETGLKQPTSEAKFCLSDPSLRAAWLGELVPLDPGALAQCAEATQVVAGHLAESTAGYFLAGIPGLEVRWLPERGDAPEVDLVIGVGDRWIPIEVKYRSRLHPHKDVQGLLAFLDKPQYRAPFGLVITREDLNVELDPRIIALPLSSLLWMK